MLLNLRFPALGQRLKQNRLNISIYNSKQFQVISNTNSQERQQESLIIGRRKPAVDFQNKFKLNSSDFDKVKTSASVMLRGRTGNKRASPGHRTNRFSNYGDPCTDYLNNPMFHSLQTQGLYNITITTPTTPHTGHSRRKR